MVSQKILTGLLVVSIILLVLSTLLTVRVISESKLTTKEKTLIVDTSESKQQASVGIAISPQAQLPTTSGDGS